MAKLTIMGDVVQIKTEMTAEEIDRVKMFAPDALKLFDNEGNEVFSVGIGDANYSKYGICFCSTDSEGKCFMTADNPVTDHDDPAEEKKLVVREFAQLINKLEAVEANITAAKEMLDAIEVKVDESVTFAG